jgi:hypothetical protein
LSAETWRWALKMVEMKTEQLLATHKMYADHGQDVGVTFYDPLMALIGYLDGMKKLPADRRMGEGRSSAGRTSREGGQPMNHRV